MKNKLQKLASSLILILLFASCTAKKGEGTGYLTFMVMMASPILLSIFIVLFKYEKERQKKLRASKKGAEFKRYRTPITIFIIIIASYLVVNFVPLQLSKNSAELFYENVQAKNHQKALNYYELEFFKKPEKTKDFLDLAYKLSYTEHLPYWENLSVDIEEIELRDKSDLLGQQVRIGASWVMSNNDYFLNGVVEKLPENGYGVDFLRGKYQIFNQEYSNAILSFEKEIDNNGFVFGAVRELSILFRSRGDKAKLESLILNPTLKEHVPHQYRKEYYYKHSMFKEYVLDLYGNFKSKFDVFGFIGGLLILLCWLIFLYRLNPFYKLSKPWILLVLLLSMIFTFVCIVVYDYFNFSLELKSKTNLFIECFFEIGLIEESMKAIPFLIAFFFCKDFKEPYSFLFYAGVSALGFAFIENVFVYLDSDGTSLITGRGLISCFAHVFDSCIMAYLLVLAQFRSFLNKWLAFILGFVIAMLSHGLFDFIILADMGPFALIIFFFMMVQVWASICNNTLNLSTNFDWNKLAGFNKVKYLFSISLISIVMGEYILLAVQMGKDVANDSLAGNMFMGLFLIVYMGLSMTNFDFFPNYLEKIVVPYKLREVFFPRIVNTDNLVLLKVKLSRAKQGTGLFLPVQGIIISRHIIKNEKDWYLVKVDTLIPIDKPIYKDHVLIKMDELNSSIVDFERVLVSLAFINVQTDISKLIFERRSINSVIPSFVEEV